MNNLNHPLDYALLQEKEKQFDNHYSIVLLGIVFMVWMMFAVIMIFTDYGYVHLNLNLFPLTLFGGGLLCTIYYQLKKTLGKDPLTSITIATKNSFVNKWFISAVIYPVAIALLFWSYSIFADELYHFYSGTAISTFSPFDGWSAPYIQFYFLLQILFLVGGLIIQKAPNLIKILGTFFKSILSIVLCVLAIRMLLMDYLKSFLVQHLHTVGKENKIF